MVFHLASRFQRSAKQTSTSGSDPTWTPRALCLTRYAAGARVLVFSSSVAVFGGDDDSPCPG